MSGLLLLLAIAAVSLPAQDALPLLRSRCAGCHTGVSAKAGLDLSSRESVLKGGAHGPAIVPGNAKASLLYKAITHEAQPHMPLGSPKLSEVEARAIAQWIDAGAPFSGTIQAEQHWSFRKPVKPAVPQSAYPNPIDAFLEAERTKRNLKPMPEADKRTLLRRVTLDLTGIPPTPEEQAAFLADRSADAYGKLVDRLLASPRYGERWARHWMDVWRYSDWYGYRRAKEVRNSQRHIWRWRDWIVESLNADKGYDRMLTEMLAGDEIAPNDPQTLRATGYLARNYSRYDRNGWMQDAVDHTAQAFLGVTLKCARCHDHKYDPFSQQDYYQFRAIFEPYQVRYDRVPGEVDTEKNGIARIYDAELNPDTYLLVAGDVQNPDKSRKLDPAVPGVFQSPFAAKPVNLKAEAYYPDLRPFVHADLLSAAKKAVADAEAMPAGGLKDRTLTAATAELASLEARIAADKAKYATAANFEELALAAREAERKAGVLKAAEVIHRAYQQIEEAKGDEKKIAAAKKHIDEAQKALTQPAEGYTGVGTAYPEKSSGRRLALAQWMASRENPLTARVAVNHIWLRHFGKALVPTVTDFGRNGKPPTHPALLDYLAVSLMENGWSTKALHRLLLTSQAYRMASTAGDESHPNAKADPDNLYLWRMNPRRMESEIVRDAILAVSGSLDTAAGGPEIDNPDATLRRSLYIAHTPDIQVPFLKMFDSPNPVECYERSESVVPQQALALANSKLSRTEAERLAERLAAAGVPFVNAAFERVLGRAPNDAERAAADRFLSTNTATARADLLHVLFNHNDFVTIR